MSIQTTYKCDFCGETCKSEYWQYSRTKIVPDIVDDLVMRYPGDPLVFCTVEHMTAYLSAYIVPRYMERTFGAVYHQEGFSD